LARFLTGAAIRQSLAMAFKSRFFKPESIPRTVVTGVRGLRASITLTP
jgi:hypothetical protein